MENVNLEEDSADTVTSEVAVSEIIKDITTEVIKSLAKDQDPADTAITEDVIIQTTRVESVNTVSSVYANKSLIRMNTLLNPN